MKDSIFNVEKNDENSVQDEIVNVVDELHYPVMSEEIVGFFANCKYVIDATFGRGGHACKLLKLGCKVLAIDRDIRACEYAEKLMLQYDRLSFKHMCFSELSDEIVECDGILFDFGVSTPQIKSDRGFSFDKDGILDMGMGLNKLTANEVLNTYSYQQLADIFYYHADEKQSKLYAKRIVEMRKCEKILYMSQLLKIFPQRTWQRIHPATKVLQALRIEVNQELREIESAMESVYKYRNNGLKMACISFHSGEDRIIKRKHRQWKDELMFYSKKPVEPTDIEVKSNLASRSAKLRLCQFI